MIQPITILPMPTPGGNTGIVPPWLRGDRNTGIVPPWLQRDLGHVAAQALEGQRLFASRWG